MVAVTEVDMEVDMEVVTEVVTAVVTAVPDSMVQTTAMADIIVVLIIIMAVVTLSRIPFSDMITIKLVVLIHRPGSTLTVIQPRFPPFRSTAILSTKSNYSSLKNN